jgi:dolichol-phosphate mannosyltransferase
MNNTDVELSIVTTIYNDAAVIKTLIAELENIAKPLHLSLEIIIVNDGSRDNSGEIIKSICAEKPYVKGINLSRNFGQQIAVSAGLRFASGKYILVIDGDLENPIDAIPLLYKKINEGFDIVYAVTKKRNSLINSITSELFWIVVCKLFKVNIIKHQLMLRIMSRKMVDYYNDYTEITRSVAGITQDIGLNYSTLEVTPQKRISGRSNYSFSKRLNIFIDIILSMSLRPLNFIIFLGFYTFIVSVITAIYYLCVYFTVGTVPGFTSTILSIFLFGSITTFTLGIIARYLSLIYVEVKNRPLFLIKEKYNL